MGGRVLLFTISPRDLVGSVRDPCHVLGVLGLWAVWCYGYTEPWLRRGVGYLTSICSSL